MVAGNASGGAHAEPRETSERASAAAAVVASVGPLAGSEVASVPTSAEHTSVHTSIQTLVCGDSVLYGDLTEFGVGASDASGSASRPRSLPLGLPPQASRVPQPGFLQQFLAKMKGLPVDTQRLIWRDFGLGDEFFVVDDVEV